MSIKGDVRDGNEARVLGVVSAAAPEPMTVSRIWEGMGEPRPTKTCVRSVCKRLARQGRLRPTFVRSTSVVGRQFGGFHTTTVQAFTTTTREPTR